MIDAFGTKSRVTYENTVGGVLQISGDTYLPRFQVTASPSTPNPLFSLNLGVRTWDDVTYPGYGKVGDGHLYASNEANGLNLINRQGTGTTEDYIRFYAGQDANGTTPDIHIAGTGATRGYVGIGTVSPRQLLDVNGNVVIQGGLTGSTISATTVSATTIVLSGTNITSSWVSYTPTWTSLGTNPVIGNGTITGAYKVIGKTCFVRGRILMGSTTTYGSGAWLIGLPLPAINAYAIQLPSSLLDNGTAWYSGLMNGGRNGNTSYSEIQVQNTGGTANGISATYPFTWGDTDELSFNGSYEIL